MLTINIRNKIRSHCLENLGVESCGLILSSGDSTLTYKCKNMSTNSGEHFEISPLDYLRAWDNGKNKIIGFYHSQESTKPSILDIINYKNHGVASYIYCFSSDEIIEVTDKHLENNKYLGRDFEIGVRDCFTLVREFYADMGISISEYKRSDKWFIDNPNAIALNYAKEGFEKININELKNGDIIEFGHYHLGIYLDGGLLLHHKRNCASSIERLTDIWKRRITNCYRYVKTS